MAHIENVKLGMSDKPTPVKNNTTGKVANNKLPKKLFNELNLYFE